MTKAAQRAKTRLESNPLYFIGDGLTCICSKCNVSQAKLKKAAFYKVWNESLKCSVCKFCPAYI